jgi:serine/threonine-protein kinase
MERLRGRDLREALASGWRPAPAQAAHLVRRVADALAYAHARGVVHCDIKPANIFLAARNRPKVLDFGIARAATAGTLPGAREATVAGSPHYLAPEQWTGGVIDARTDLYALGVVLYELLTGHKAFPGDSLAAIQAAVLERSPAPAHEVRPEVPPALSAIVAKAMAREPTQRFARATELAAALRHWEGSTGARRAAGPGDGPHARHGRLTGRPLRTALAFSGLAVLAVAAAAWALRSPATAPGAAAPVAALAVPTVATTAPLPAATVQAVNSEPPAAAASDAQTAAATAPSSDAGDPTPASAPAAVAQADRPANPPRKPAPARPAVRSATPPRAATPTTPAAPMPTAPVNTGTVQFAVSPWGQVEVNGQGAGTTPPLTRLTLPEGTHQVTVRNADFAPYTVTVEVQGDRPVTVRHRFGS